MDKKLLEWRKFRLELSNYDLKTALSTINSYWQRAPFTPYYLDHNDISSWPDPWTLINENIFCDLARALSMYYTVCFSEHKKDNTVELCVYKCMPTRYEYNLVLVNDGKYILNYSDELVNKNELQQELILIKKFTSAELEDNY